MINSKRAAPCALQGLIRKEAERRGLTPYKVAQLCGWPPATIYRKIAHRTGSDSLERMMAVCGIDVIADGKQYRLTIGSDGEVRAVRVRKGGV